MNLIPYISGSSSNCFLLQDLINVEKFSLLLDKNVIKVIIFPDKALQLDFISRDSNKGWLGHWEYRHLVNTDLKLIHFATGKMNKCPTSTIDAQY